MRILLPTPLSGRGAVSLLGRKNDKVYLHYAFYKLCILIFSRLLRICHTPAGHWSQHKRTEGIAL